MKERRRDSENRKTSTEETTTKPRACPICHGPSVQAYRPFCSRRCADIDLSRWLSGRYAIAGGDADEDEDGDQARAADLSQRPEGGDEL
jgi:uncharacterized protein